MRPSRSGEACPRGRDRITDFNARRGALIIALLVLAIFGPSVTAPFVYDDHKVVVGSPLTKSWATLPHLVKSSYFELSGDPVHYRPVATLSHRITWALLGGSPAGHHLVNVLIHLSACLLLYGLLSRLARVPVAAFLATLWFAVHPAPSEAVFGVTFRRDALVLLFLLASLPGAGKILAEDRGRIPGSLWLGLCFFLALGSKENAAAFILLLPGALHSLLPATGQPPPDPRAWRLIALALLSPAAGYGALRYHLSSHSRVVNEPDPRQSNLEYGLRPLKHLGVYTRLVIWPRPLSVERPAHPGAGLADPDVWAGVIVLLLALRMGRSRSRPPLAAAGLAGYLLFLAPVLVFALDRTGERYLYVPMACLSLLVVDLIDRTATRPVLHRFTTGALLVLIGLEAFATRVECDRWRNPILLYGGALALDPDNHRMHVGLAGVYLERGELEEAERHLQAALALYPASDRALQGLALVARAARDFHRADRLYQEAIDRMPVNVDALIADRAVMLAANMGRVKDALAILEARRPRALSSAPVCMLAKILARAGLPGLALRALDQDAVRFPGDPDLERLRTSIPPPTRSPEAELRLLGEIRAGRWNLRSMN